MNLQSAHAQCHFRRMICTGAALAALLTCSATGQLTTAHLSGDGVLNAPYRGPATAWREANLDMSYGEVINYKLFLIDGANRAQITGGWNKDVVRVYYGWDASGNEITGGTLNTDRLVTEGNTRYWRISIKAIGTRSSFAPATAEPILVKYLAFEDPGCDASGYPGVNKPVCCEWLFDPWFGTYCAEGCDDACGCVSLNSCQVFLPDQPLLSVRVGPTAASPEPAEHHRWYPGSTALTVAAGAVRLDVVVNETTSMIGQSFLVVRPADTYKQQLSIEVRLPGMPETTFVQPKALFTAGPGLPKERIGTPWAGHMPGWWVEGDGVSAPFDVRGPDGTVYRFSENTAGTVPTKYLKQIIPPGVDPANPSAYVTYHYTTIGTIKYVTRMEDNAGNYIALSRIPAGSPGAGRVTTISTGNGSTPDGRSWTIGTDANTDGYISLIDPVGVIGSRTLVHDSAGRLTGIKGNSTQDQFQFTYGTNQEIQLERAFFAAGVLTLTASYTYAVNGDPDHMRQTLIPGFGSPNRQLNCTYDGHILETVEIGGETRTYHWDEENPRGTVRLERIDLPSGPGSTPEVHVARGFRSTSGDEFPFVERISLKPPSASAADLELYNVVYDYKSGNDYFRMPRIKMSLDGEGNVTTLSYDPAVTDFHRPISVTGPAATGFSDAPATTEYTYYSTTDARRGLIEKSRVKMTDSHWLETLYDYDSARRLTKIHVDPANKNLSTDYAVEPLRVDGQPTLTKDASNFHTRFSYSADQAGRLSTITQYLVTGAVSGGSYDTLFSYNNETLVEFVDRPIRNQDGVTIGGQTQRKQYVLDNVGRVTQVVVGKPGTSSPMDAFEYVARGFKLNNLGELVKVTDQDGLYEKFDYSNRGQLQSRTPGYNDVIGGGTDGPAYTGMVATYVYDNAGRLDKVTYADGRELDYSQNRDQFGRVSTILEMPNGAQSIVAYDDNNQVIDLNIFQDGVLIRSVETHFDELQRPFRVFEGPTVPQVSRGNITLMKYRLDGLMERVVRKGAHPCTGVENGSDLLDESHIDQQQLGDHLTVLGYDSAGRLTQIEESSDQVTCPSAVAALRITTLELDEGGNARYIRTGTRETAQQFDALGRLIESTPPTGATTFTNYNSLSLPILSSTTDTQALQSGDTSLGVTAYEYDAVGRLVFERTVDGSLPPSLSDAVIEFQYLSSGNNHGRLVRIIDAANRSTSFTYDDANRVRRATDAFGNMTTSEFDIHGRLSQLMVAEHESLVRSLNFQYEDPLGRETRILRNGDPDSKIEQHRNVFGSPTGIRDLRSITHSIGRDAMQRVTTVTEAQGLLPRQSLAAYGHQGLKALTFNPGGGAGDQVTMFRRAPAGAVRETVFPDDNTPGNNTVQREYDVFGDVTGTTDQRGIAVTSATTTVGEHRVTRTVQGDNYDYVFDGVGRLVSATHAPVSGLSSTVEFGYDGHGRLATETQTLGASTYSTEYRYNPAAELAEITYPCAAGASCTNILDFEARSTPLDGLGRPRRVDFNGIPFADYTWEGLSLKTSAFFAPGGGAQPFIDLTVDRDSFGRQVTREWRGRESGTLTKTIERTELVYDAGDYLMQSISNLPGRSLAVVIDALARVTRLARGSADATGRIRPNSELVEEDRSQAPGMDLLGNLLRTVRRMALPNGGFQVIQNLVQAISNANEITRFDRIINGMHDATVDLVYDYAGNLIADGEQYYKYDGLNHLVEVGEQGAAVLNPDGSVTGTLGPALAKFTYDAIGRRITQEILPPAEPRLPDGVIVGIERYLYAGHRVLEVRDAGDGELLKRHFYSPEALDARIRTDDYVLGSGPSNPAVFYFPTDRLGSPSAAVVYDSTTDSAEVVERFLFDAQGKIYVSAGENVCLRADVNCDGLVGAVDLVLVRQAFGPAPGQGEDVCGPSGGPPDSVVNDEDLACVRAALGKGPDLTETTQATGTTSDKTLGMHGLPFDHATGLVFARARYYHPDLGRWMRRDPKGYVDGGNLYEAFRSNPLAYTDPMGEGVLTWLLVGDYGLSDSQFVRAGGLQAAAYGAAEGGVTATYNVGVGAVKTGRELAYTAADIAIAPVDIASTLIFHKPLGNPFSQIGEASSHADAEELGEIIGETGIRSVAGVVTLGASNVIEGTYNYYQTGDEEAFSQSVGGTAAFTLGTVGLARAGTAGVRSLRTRSTSAGASSADSLSGPISGRVARTGDQVAPRNLNAYETYFEARITGNTRAAHRSAANRNLANELGRHTDLADTFNREFGTNVLRHMQSGKKLLNPPGTVWHHPATNPNVMHLLRTVEHTNPALQTVLHPDGVGGFGNFYGP